MILNNIIEQFYFPGGWWGFCFVHSLYGLSVLFFTYYIAKRHLALFIRITKLQCRFLYINIFGVFMDCKFNQVCNIFFFFWASVLFINGLSLFSYTFNPFICFRTIFTLTFFLFTNILFQVIMSLRMRIFGLFMPCNVPGYLIKSLIIIETFVFFLRIFSLSLRLFINLVSGHIFLKLIFTLGLHLFSNFIFSGFFLIDVYIFIFFFICFCSLEMFVASLQTFIYFFLLTIYLKELFPDNDVDEEEED